MKVLFYLFFLFSFSNCVTDKACVKQDPNCSPLLNSFFIQILTKQNIYLAGGISTSPFMTNWFVTPSSWLLKKYDLNGSEDLAHWNKSWSYNSNPAFSNMPMALDVDNNENVYFGGFAQTGAASSPPLINSIQKIFKSDGREIHHFQYTMSPTNAIFSTTLDNSGNLYIGGVGVNIINTTSGADWFIKKLDPLKNEILSISFENTTVSFPNDMLKKIAVDTSQNIIAGGTTQSALNQNPVIAKFDAKGNLLWILNMPTGNNTDLTGLQVDKYGFILVTMNYFNLASATSSMDGVIKKIDPNGNEIWQTIIDFGKNSDDFTTGIKLDANNNILVYGGFSSNNPNLDAGILQLDANGNITKQVFYDAGNNNNEAFQDISIDNNGYIYATGHAHNIASSVSGSPVLSNRDLIIRKFSPGLTEDTTFNILFDRGIGAAEEGMQIYIK